MTKATSNMAELRPTLRSWPLFATQLSLPSLRFSASPAACVRNRMLVEDRFEAWAAGNGSPFELLADDCSWTIEGHSLVAGTYSSRDALLKEVLEPFNARMLVPLRPEARRLYADGETVIAAFAVHGVARGGKPYDNKHVWLLQLSRDRIVRANAFFDAIKFNELWMRVKPAVA